MPLFRRSRPPPLTGPQSPFNRRAASRDRLFRGAPQRSAEMSALLRFGKQLRSSYPTHHSTRHSAAESPDLPCHPTPDFCHNPEERDLPAEDRHTIRDTPFLSDEEPRAECSCISSPRRSECSAFGSPKAKHSNACPLYCPRQQRGAEHSRSYSKTSITANQRIWMSRHIVPGTNRPLDSPSPHKLSPEDNPRLSAPCGRHAARSRMSVLASCVSHPACRCVRLVWRPQAV